MHTISRVSDSLTHPSLNYKSDITFAIWRSFSCSCGIWLRLLGVSLMSSLRLSNIQPIPMATIQFRKVWVIFHFFLVQIYSETKAAFDSLFCLWHIEIDEGQGFPLTPWLLLCIPAVQIVFVIIHFESNLIKKCVRFGYHLSIVCLGLRGREKD